MHTRMIDLSRTAACYREPADDLRPGRGILFAVFVSLPLWLLAVALGTIVIGGLSHAMRILAFSAGAM
jgi:hypothetical protein